MAFRSCCAPSKLPSRTPLRPQHSGLTACTSWLHQRTPRHYNNSSRPGALIPSTSNNSTLTTTIPFTALAKTSSSTSGGMTTLPLHCPAQPEPQAHLTVLLPSRQPPHE